MKRTPLKRTGGPKRKPRKRYDPDKAREFWGNVCIVPSVTKHRFGGTTSNPPRRARCAVCGHTAQDAHHILPKQFIYSECKTARVNPDDYLWDVRNGLPLCRPCHDGHEGGSERLSRSYITQDAWAFIVSIDHLSKTVRATEKVLTLYGPFEAV